MRALEDDYDVKTTPDKEINTMRMTSITTAQIAGRVTEISFCAWLAQAEPGDRLEYHRGYLAVDTDKLMSKLIRGKVG